MAFSDLGMKLSLPYNFADDYIDKVLLPYAELTTEVYLAVFWAVSPSARNWTASGGHTTYLKKVDRLYEVANKYGISLNFVANVVMDPRQARLVVDEAAMLHSRYPGSSFTLRSLEVAMMLKREVPAAEISPSTLAFIDSVVKAMYWRKAVNPRVITVAREINRKPDILGQLKDMGFLIKLIPQDTCIPYCPVMHEHDKAIELRDQLGQASVVPIPLRAAECRPFAMAVKADPELFWLVATKDVLPGHLHHLKGLVDILKIEGRQNDSDGISQKVEYYLKAKSLKSFEIVFYEEPPEAWERIAHCDRNCFSCDWCRQNIRFIGTSSRQLVSPDGHELGKGVETDGQTKEITVLRVEFNARSQGRGFELEIAPSLDGWSCFVKTSRFCVSYSGKDSSSKMFSVIDELVQALRRDETKPGFGLDSVGNLVKRGRWAKDYRIRVRMDRRGL